MIRVLLADDHQLARSPANLGRRTKGLAMQRMLSISGCGGRALDDRRLPSRRD
jgi:hypothetical protein